MARLERFIQRNVNVFVRERIPVEHALRGSKRLITLRENRAEGFKIQVLKLRLQAKSARVSKASYES